MSRSGAEAPGPSAAAWRAPGALLWLLVAPVLILLLAAGPAVAQPVPAAAAAGDATPQRAGGFTITPAVRQQLRQLQEEWLHWVSAADRERSQAAVSEMLATAGQLGMVRLP